MNTMRWTNQGHPQTLQIAVMLLYIDAVFAVITGSIISVLGLAILAGSIGGGLGTANSKRWGYRLAVAVAALGVLPLVILLSNDGVSRILSFNFIAFAIFPVVLLVALLHPLSRSYQRIWFD